jgi:hypothetical protein
MSLMSKKTPLASLEVFFLTLGVFLAALAAPSGAADETPAVAPLTRGCSRKARLRDEKTCASCDRHNAARPRPPVCRNLDVEDGACGIAASCGLISARRFLLRQTLAL